MDKIVVDKAGNWRLYWGPGPLPERSKALGTIRFEGTGRAGALVRMPTGIYVQGNAGSVRSLPQAEVRRELGEGQDHPSPGCLNSWEGLAP